MEGESVHGEDVARRADQAPLPAGEHPVAGSEGQGGGDEAIADAEREQGPMCGPAEELQPEDQVEAGIALAGPEIDLAESGVSRAPELGEARIDPPRVLGHFEDVRVPDAGEHHPAP